MRRKVTVLGAGHVGANGHEPAAGSDPRAMRGDQKKVLPRAACPEGEHGVRGLSVGVPVVPGAGGAGRVVEPKLAPGGAAAPKKSADAVAELREKLTC